MEKVIGFSAGKLVGDTLYFSCNDFCGLYKMDISQQKVIFVSYFPDEDVLQKYLHRKVLVFGENLFFIPSGGGKNIHVYNYMTGDIRYVPIFNERGWEGEAFIEDRYLWMIPYDPRLKCVVKMDLESLEIEEIHNFFGELTDWQYDDKNGRIFQRLAIAGESIWFAVLHTNEIVQISLEDCKITRYQIEIDDLFGIFIVQNDMWVASHTKQFLYKWNPQKGVYERCSVEGCKQDLIPANNIFEVAGNIYALPHSSEYITKYNHKTCCFEKVVEYSSSFYFTDPDQIKFSQYDCCQDKIICFPFNSQDCLLIDTNNNITSILSTVENIDISVEPYLHIGEKLLESKFVSEDKFIALREFIQLMNIKKDSQKPIILNEAGTKIYRSLAD